MNETPEQQQNETPEQRNRQRREQQQKGRQETQEQKSDLADDEMDELTKEEIEEQITEFQPGRVRMHPEMPFDNHIFELNIKSNNIIMDATYFIEVDAPDGMIYEFHGVQPVRKSCNPADIEDSKIAIFDVSTAKVAVKRIFGA